MRQVELQLLILIAQHQHLLFFRFGNTTATNGTGTYVAYCFAEIAGYSKFGKFIGNNVIAKWNFCVFRF